MPDEERRGRVLVVDDEPGVRLALEVVLCRDFEVKAVSSAAEAEAALAKEPFEVLLTDYEMPEGTGIDLLNRVSEKFPDVMVMLLTGYTQHAEVRAAQLDMRVFMVVSKPYEPPYLINRVKQAATLSRVRQRTRRLERLTGGRGG
jgi:DNA-binding NtrC family response regulator